MFCERSVSDLWTNRVRGVSDVWADRVRLDPDPYRAISPIKKRPHPYDPPTPLGIGLL